MHKNSCVSTNPTDSVFCADPTNVLLSKKYINIFMPTNLFQEKFYMTYKCHNCKNNVKNYILKLPKCFEFHYLPVSGT